jgi:hypothetical protein
LAHYLDADKAASLYLLEQQAEQNQPENIMVPAAEAKQYTTPVKQEQ